MAEHAHHEVLGPTTSLLAEGLCNCSLPTNIKEGYDTGNSNIRMAKLNHALHDIDSSGRYVHHSCQITYSYSRCSLDHPNHRSVYGQKGPEQFPSSLIWAYAAYSPH
eukprot:139802-Hanusia_phi.AAC.1